MSGGNTIDVTVEGSTTHYAFPLSFDPYKQYFKAGSYNQSSSQSTTNGVRVTFYALTVAHAEGLQRAGAAAPARRAGQAAFRAGAAEPKTSTAW